MSKGLKGKKFGVSVCQLIFKQQAGSVLVTDKGPDLSSHSLTSSHSALLSGHHLESGKQLRARRERPQREDGRICVCVCLCTCVCSVCVSLPVCLETGCFRSHVCGRTAVQHLPFLSPSPTCTRPYINVPARV